MADMMTAPWQAMTQAGAVVGAERDVGAALAVLERRLVRARPFNIGFPGAVDFDYTPLARLLTRELLNNVGDPYVDGVGANHTKAIERDVVGFVADLLHAPNDRRWGYVTTGGSESNLFALHQARRRHRDAVFYRSDAAHYSVEKAIEMLRVPSAVVRTTDTGEVNYDDLAVQVSRHRGRAAVVIANIGTTMTEAIDDVRRIIAVLDNVGVTRRYIHADAALAGIPLALVDPTARPGFDFADGADSVAVSGHKFVGSPFPCGVVVVRTRHPRPPDVPYLASPDTTVTGSRSGHAPLVLWYALAHHGVDGLRERAERSRMLAAYTCTKLAAIGWSPYRSHAHAFTVVFKTPPIAVLDRWTLASSNGWSHIICVPGVRRQQIDAFVRDLAAAAGLPATSDG